MKSAWGVAYKVACGVCLVWLAVVLVVAVHYGWRALVADTFIIPSDSMELLKLADEERSMDAMLEALSSALDSFSVDTSDGYISYEGCTFKVPPRVAVFLEALARKEDHALSLEELNGLFHARFYDGTESSHSRIRNMKCTVHKSLRETPFDVARDASGNFRLVLKKR